ncbi:CHAD domain-containing protein [Flavobacterium sp. LB2P44]|uniref:CHAD domain-containing protein n=1 Tax=Flavobacterium sp. LB2P44 TaxID=3401713 RepID=UPI003AAE50E1
MKALQTYFKKRKSALNLLFKKKPLSYTVETFHELRVEIKKIKALFELMVFCSKKLEQKETFKPFKMIFRVAGEVRELQLEQIILEKEPTYYLLRKYHKRLERLETKSVKKFFTIVNKHLIKKLKEKYPKIITVLTKISSKKAHRYINKIRNKTRKLISKDAYKKNQIHEFRKRLKVYQYNDKIFDLDDQNKLIPDKTFLLNMLGEWHDYHVILIHLKRFISTEKTNPNEKKHLKSIKVAITSKSKILHERINALLPISKLHNTEIQLNSD